MAALIEKSKKRIMKDVETASKSDEYKFHYNDEGVGYINFITPSGIYKKMNHIVEITENGSFVQTIGGAFLNTPEYIEVVP